MAKEEGIVVIGEVTDIMRNATFRIRINETKEVIGYISGKMRKHEIRISLGDRVEIEFSPYDLSKGRIIRRL